MQNAAEYLVIQELSIHLLIKLHCDSSEKFSKFGIN